MCAGVEEEAFVGGEEDLAAELFFEDADLGTDDADAERVDCALVGLEVWSGERTVRLLLHQRDVRLRPQGLLHPLVRLRRFLRAHRLVVELLLESVQRLRDQQRAHGTEVLADEQLAARDRDEVAELFEA